MKCVEMSGDDFFWLAIPFLENFYGRLVVGARWGETSNGTEGLSVELSTKIWEAIDVAHVFVVVDLGLECVPEGVPLENVTREVGQLQLWQLGCL